MQLFEEEVKKEEKKEGKRKIHFEKNNVYLILGALALAFLLAFFLRGKSEVVLSGDVEAQRRMMKEVLETQRKINEELVKEIRSLREELKNLKAERKEEVKKAPPVSLEKLVKEEKRGRYEIVRERKAPSVLQPPPLKRIERKELKKKRVSNAVVKREGKKRKTVYLPSGTVFKGRILHGFPAPVGGKKFPAVMIEVEGDAKLPNEIRFPLKKCVVLATAEGTWVGERAKLQAKKLSCVLKNGKVIERDINGFIVSTKDGIEGVKGKFLQVNRKQILTYLGATTIGGFFSAMQETQTQTFGGVFGTTRTIKDEFLYSLYGSLAQTWNEFARWYLEQAKEIVPIVFVKAGEPVYVTLIDGVSLGVSTDEVRDNT